MKNVSIYRLKRIIRIVEMLKKKKYPNANTIVKEFERSTYDMDETIILSCTARTVMRDLDVLRKQFLCPLAYDRHQHGYYLKDEKWDFAYPAYLLETQMMALLMGRKISENIFPEPLRTEILESVDYLLNIGNPNLLQQSFVSQLQLFSAKCGIVDSKVFECVYQAWREHKSITIEYKDNKDNISTRTVEPHGLFFYHNSWYINCFCHKANDKRMFMIHRIQKAKCTNTYFTPNSEYYENIIFDHNLIKNVVLKFHKSIHDNIFTTPFHDQQEILWEIGDNENFKIVKIPEISEDILIPRILGALGKITIIEPTHLKEKVKTAAQAVISAIDT